MMHREGHFIIRESDARKKRHRNVWMAPSQLVKDSQPVTSESCGIRQPHVKNGSVDRSIKQPYRFLNIAGVKDGEAHQRQHDAERLLLGWLVFDEQDTHT